MDEELKRVLALDDEARADAERDEAHRAWLAKRSAAPTGVDVDEWLASRSKQTKPQRAVPAPRQPSVVTLSPEVQKRWDKWADGRVMKLFKPGAPLGDVIAEIISLVRREWREEIAAEAKKLREEIAGLRTDEVIGRSILRGELNELRETTTAKKKVRL